MCVCVCVCVCVCAVFDNVGSVDSSSNNEFNAHTGTFGSLMGTPIINPPQSAVLGMHGIFDRPVARDGQVVIRPMMYVCFVLAITI